jgi:XTP/dITP diphosphohydrolase
MGEVQVRDLLIATGNQGKLREIRAALEGLPYRVLGAQDVGGLPEVVEDGETLLENAQKKARSAAAAKGLLALADDTGLEVDALDGAPGVYAARYAGEGCSYEDNWRKLLTELDSKGARDRGATFRTVMVLAEPGGREDWVAGSLRGEISREPRGQDGFGYDPVFYLPRFKKTFAEMSLEEKNRVSHRGEALKRAKMLLLRW